MYELGPDEQRLVAAVDGEAERILDRLSRLVRISSVNPNCGEPDSAGEFRAQTMFRSWLDECGFQTRLESVPNDVFQRHGLPPRTIATHDGRPNLIGIREFGDGSGPTVILNGHMDTVGTANMPEDPLSGEVHDGKLYGRGASDDKSGLVGALYAVHALETVSSAVSGTVLFESVVDEECGGGGAGTLSLCRPELSADAAIVVDGTNNNLGTESVGTLTARVEVVGRGGHASNDGLVNAVSKAMALARETEQFGTERRSTAAHRRFNIGTFRGGTVSSMVPDHAVFEVNFDYDLLDIAPSDMRGSGHGARPNGDVVKRRFEETLRRYERTDPWLADHPSTILWRKDLYPFCTSPDTSIGRAMSGSLRALGRSADQHRTTRAAWCDAAHIATQLGIPTVIFGPLEGDQCHGPDEFVRVDRLMEFTRILAVALFRFLGNGRAGDPKPPVDARDG